MKYKIKLSETGSWIELTLFDPVTIKLEKEFTEDLANTARAVGLMDCFIDATRAVNQTSAKRKMPRFL